MNRLGIDFVRRARSPWAARALLAAALALAADAALTYRDTLASLQSAEARLGSGAPRAAPRREPAAAEVAAVRETVERLALPWDELFAALESAAGDEVALLGIEPDPKAGTVLISGDSKDYLSALGYVLTLSKAEGLSRVQLVRHDAKGDDPRGPVSFAVSAAWKGGAR